MARSVAQVVVASIVTSVVCATANAQQVQWTQSPNNGHWYGVEYATTSWTQGEAEAVSLGGHLATVRSQSENAWIAAALGALVAPNNEGFWIGANDAQVEGQLVWSSGESPTFTNWYPGEPNNLFDEDYVQIGTNFAWNDRDDAGPTNPRPLVEVLQRLDTGWSWPQFYATGSDSKDHCVADVDGDDHLDLLIPLRASSEIVVLRSNGQGQFTHLVTLTTSAGPIGVAAADFDRDGHQDIAAACYDGQAVQIHRGTGGGGFIIGQTLFLGANAHGIAVADLNGDGWPDVAATTLESSDSVWVALNDGNGSLLPATAYPSGLYSQSVAAVDVNHDNHPDLLVACAQSNSIAVYINDGAGNFSAPSYTPSGGNGPVRIGVGDLNHDGNVDLAIPNHESGCVAVFHGHGDGTFTQVATIAVAPLPRSGEIGDIDGDGRPDIVVAHSNATTISVVLNANSPSFAPPIGIEGGDYTRSLSLNDLNEDGMLDISGAAANSSNIAVIMNEYSCSAIASYCTSSTTTHGCTPVMAGTGGPSASATSGFNVTVTGVEGQKNGLIFYGTSPTAVAWAIGSYSYVCVAPPVQRTAITNSAGTLGGCDGVLTIDFNSFMASNPTAYGSPFIAGEVFYAQGWFRDPGAVKGTNLSNGLQFRLCN